MSPVIDHVPAEIAELKAIYRRDDPPLDPLDLQPGEVSAHHRGYFVAFISDLDGYHIEPVHHER